MEVLNRLERAYKALTTQVNVTDEANTFRFKGLIRAYSVPFETEAEYRKWWLPEVKVVAGRQVLVAPARMKQREKNRYFAAEGHNLLTANGRTQVLGFIGTPTYISTQTAFSQYFAVGTNSPFAGATSGDTLVNGEIARVVPSSVILTGTQADISCFFSTAAGNGTWTNCGLFGATATSTPSSGVLMTHAAFAYPKTVASAVTCDYLINLL